MVILRQGEGSPNPAIGETGLGLLGFRAFRVFRVQGLGFEGFGLGFRVFRIESSGFRV